MKPRKLIHDCPKIDLFACIVRSYFEHCLRIKRCFSYSSNDLLAIKTSCKYAYAKSNGAKTSFINLWNIWDALHSSNGIRVHSNKSNEVVIAVFGISSLWTGI